MMKKTVVIHQPDFIPYLGFFHRFLSADLYIVLDHVQFVQHTNRSWTHRDKIKTRQGQRWLTISVKKASLGTPINNIELSKEIDWQSANLRVIEENYRDASYYSEIMPLIKDLYENSRASNSSNRLMDFNLASIEMLMKLLDVELPWVLSSTLNPTGKKNEQLIDLLEKVDATHYISGVGAKDYLQESYFNEANIELIWQNFNHPVYPQQFGEFIPYLSTLDLLFNCGVNTSRKILRGIQ